MRFLGIHVDYFSSKITQKGRSKLIEPYDDPVTEVNEALVLLTSVEKGDETAPNVVADRAADEIVRLAGNLKSTTVVLHSFAHLFAELSTPEVAMEVMKGVEERLRARGFTVIRTPFGYFNTLDIKAKGHPLSRVARIIRAD
ncbi:MAG: threonyl-tRNA synthetase editing domain-containing protein [Bacteroidetes bacterium]|nr:threonyl-tRNA synthetase editing domain-containing protein [Bacteroidota bacterium]